MEMLDSDEKLKERFQKDLDFYNTNKFEIGVIYNYFDILSDRLYATTCLIELIEKYKNFKFKINKMYENLDKNSLYEYNNILFSSSTDILQYITNPEICRYGKQLYTESIKKHEEKHKITEEISQLETTIFSKLSKNNKNL